MFMDSNKLQNYEKIRSSDQSHIRLPFITSILSPQPPPTSHPQSPHYHGLNLGKEFQTF